MFSAIFKTITDPIFWAFVIGSFFFVFAARPIIPKLTRKWLRENYVMLILLCALLLTASALTFYLVEIAISVSGLVDRLHAAVSDPTANTEDLRHLGTTIALLMGVLAAAATIFFSIIRVWINERTASAEEEALLNDKINNAVNDLHAQRQITKWLRTGTQNGWQDDVTRRNGAIDRLEGLAGEEPKAVPRIARMLSVYVRELSREHPPKKAPISHGRNVLLDWALALTPARSDMQNAVQVLGRLKKTTGLPLDSGEIDLTETNLQGFHLDRLDFDKAKMQGAKMQNCDLTMTQLRGVNLGGAEMQWAYVKEACLQGAYLIGVHLQGANLEGARLQGAIFYKAKFDSSASFSRANFRGTALMGVDLSTAKIGPNQLQQAFGDASVTGPDGHGPDHASWPKHWSKEKLDWKDFETKWRAFQARIGQDPLNPT
jgi:uncharacterized protein YjbI with pentapeptide repeats